MKDQMPANMTRILYGRFKSRDRRQAIKKEKLGLAKPANGSSLYDLVKNEGEDGSDGLERLDSCQGWEGIATL